MGHENGDAVVGEDALLYVRHRHGSLLVGAGAIAQSFVRAKEKQLVSDNFPPGSCAELIALERRFGWSYGRRKRESTVDVREKVFRVERAIPEEVVGGAMQSVRAALGDGVDLSGAAAELRRIGIRLHLARRPTSRTS